MNNKLEELIEEGNKSKIRVYILTILTTNPYNSVINKIVEYIEKNALKYIKKMTLNH